MNNKRKMTKQMQNIYIATTNKISFKMIGIIFIISNLAIIQCQMSFVGKMVCVFTPSAIMKSSSLFDCAIKCSSSNCQIFYFDEEASNCSFYKFNETCDSRNVCKYAKAYFNVNHALNVR